MLRYLFIVFMLIFGVCVQAQTSCSFDIEEPGFDYTLDVDLTYNNVVLDQSGTTCNASVFVDYQIDLSVVAAQFGPIFFININLGCGAVNDVITLTVPNGGLTAANNSVSGTLDFGDFDFPNTICDALDLACDATITVQGGGGLNENMTPCGSISVACARSIF